jgi:hypothetical protein
VTYHVYVDGSNTLIAINLDEATLEERFLQPYREGRGITWDGRSVASSEIEGMSVYESDELLPADQGWRAVNEHGARKVTNQFVTEPPGSSVPRTPSRRRPTPVSNGILDG